MTNTMSASTETSGFFHLAFVSRLRLHFLPFCLSPRNSEVDPEACPVDRPRKPHLTPFYQCVQDHYETLEQVYQERFEKRYGFWPPCR